MHRLMLTNTLCTDKFKINIKKPSRKFISRFRYEFVSDKYWETEIDEDTYIDAFKHGLQVARYKDSAEYYLDSETYIHMLEKDINVFLQSVDIRCQNPLYNVNSNDIDNRFRTLILLLLELDPENKLDFVKDYYDANTYDGKFDGAYAIDFYDIFTAAADKALFLNGNLALAFKYYGLSGLDWYGNNLKSCQNTNKKHKMAQEKLTLYIKLKSVVENSCLQGSLCELNLMHLFNGFLSVKSCNTEQLDAIEKACADLLELFVQSDGIDDILRLKCFVVQTLRKRYYSDALSQLDMQKEISLEDKNGIVEAFSKIELDSVYNNLLYFVEWIGEIGIRFNFIVENNRVLRIVKSIQECLLVRDDTIKVNRFGESEGPLLANYTNLNGLLRLISFPESGSVKGNKKHFGQMSIMHQLHMNDPKEGKTLQQYVFGSSYSPLLREHREIKNTSYVFLKCFTARIDFLPMWKMYGDDAKGCCIIFDCSNMIGEAVKFPLYNVCYISDEQDEPKFLEKLKDDNKHIADQVASIADYLAKIRCIVREGQKAMEAINNNYALFFQEAVRDLLTPISYLFKDNAYSYEEETRLVYNYPGLPEGLQHVEVKDEYGNNIHRQFVYSDFKVKINEVILGPKFPDVANNIPFIQAELDKFARSCKYGRTDITKSNIDFR